MHIIVSRTGRPHIPAGFTVPARYTDRSRAELIARALGNGAEVWTLAAPSVPGAVRVAHELWVSP